MKQYEEYMESNLKWLGKIPSHWELLNVKALFIERKEKNTPQKTDFVLSLTAKQGVIPYSEKTGGGNKAKEDVTLYNITYPGDLLVNCMNVVSGSSGVSTYYGAISPVYYALFPRDEHTNIWYYSYIFRLSLFYQSLVGLGNGIMMRQSSTGKLNTVRKRIPMNKLNRIQLPKPPHDEQNQIVRFLNWKVSEVNHIIRAKRKEIRLLEELKKSVITKAVTQGIDNNVDLKVGKFTWGWKIPTSWDEVKLKRILIKLDRPYTSEDELLICSNNGTVFPRGDKRIGLVAANDDVYQGVAEGDLLIHGMDTWHGAIAISNYSGKCTTVVHVCDSSQNKRFIAYYLRMMAFRKLYKAISNGVRQNTSDFRSWNKTGDIVIALPPRPEQDRIADYLDQRCGEIDNLILSLKNEISHLDEYRTRMIADVVTGKVDVRNIEVPDQKIEGDNEPEDEDSENEFENTDEMEVIENDSD